MQTIRNRWAGGLALLLALGVAASPLPAVIGSLLQVAQMGTLVSNTASLLAEAEKRFDQLTDSLDELESVRDRLSGDVQAVGNMTRQLGTGWQGLYADATALVRDTANLPADLRAVHGDLFDSLTALPGSESPVDEWRAYAGTPVPAGTLMTALGVTPGSRAARTLEASLAALQRAETLGTSTRQAARAANATVQSARTANAQHRQETNLEKASQTALLQKLIATMLTTNELLGALAQVEALTAAAGTLETEERQRRRNAYAQEMTESRRDLEAERLRLANLRDPEWTQNGVHRLYGLGWLTGRRGETP